MAHLDSYGRVWDLPARELCPACGQPDSCGDCECEPLDDRQAALLGGSPRLERRYHVPRSQVWQGSRGGQSGRVHLHTLEPFELGRLRRRAGLALCGRAGWYERAPEGAGELGEAALCPRCVGVAVRLSIAGAKALGGR